MDVITGLGVGLLVMVLGAGGLTAFAIHLSKRDKRNKKQGRHLRHA